MNFATSLFYILSKEKRELEYIKDVYKRRVQSEIESYKDAAEEEQKDNIQSNDLLMLDKKCI